MPRFSILENGCDVAEQAMFFFDSSVISNTNTRCATVLSRWLEAPAT